jgi:hypothetical protein
MPYGIADSLYRRGREKHLAVRLGRSAILILGLTLAIAVTSLVLLAYPWVHDIIDETTTRTDTTRSTYVIVRSSTYTAYSTSDVNFTYYLLHVTNTYYSTTSSQEAVSTTTSTPIFVSTNHHTIAVPPYNEYGLTGSVFLEVIMLGLLLCGAVLFLGQAVLRARRQQSDLWIWSCPRCGMKLQPSARFCDRCGSPQNDLR